MTIYKEKSNGFESIFIFCESFIECCGGIWLVFINCNYLKFVRGKSSLMRMKICHVFGAN